MVFAQTLFTRAVEPVIPQIAADLLVDVSTAALLSTAFAFPYALVQPALGTIGDFFGKTRLMNVCLVIVVLSALACAVATSFPFLVAMRVVAGIVAGGVFPIAMALVGDLVPINQRQVAIGRLLAVGLTGNLVGASFAGVIGDVLGWRGVFAILGLFGLIVAIMAFFAFRSVVPAPPPRRSIGPLVLANFRSIFADPRAKVCFGAVFLEGDLHPRAVSLRGAPAAADRRDARLDRRARHRRLRGRRRHLYARRSRSCWPCAGARPDDRRRRASRPSGSS